MRCAVLAMLLLVPVTVSSAGYSRTSNAEYVVYQMDERVVVVRQPAMVTRVARFIAKYRADGVRKAEIICAVTSDPMTMTAIAAAESRFDSAAVGSAGELSMFQILDWPEGKDPLDDREAAIEADRIYVAKLRQSHGNRFVTIKRYNGWGQAALNYSRQVSALRKRI